MTNVACQPPISASVWNRVYTEAALFNRLLEYEQHDAKHKESNLLFPLEVRMEEDLADDDPLTVARNGAS